MSARANVLLWFGLLGAPLAWALQLVVGYGVEEAGCAQGSRRWGLPTHAFQIVILCVCLAVALGSAIAAAWSWRAAERGRVPNRRGRVAFLAYSGLLASALFLALIVLSGAGAITLDTCERS